jgi:hypothetical protein
MVISGTSQAWLPAEPRFADAAMPAMCWQCPPLCWRCRRSSPAQARLRRQAGSSRAGAVPIPLEHSLHAGQPPAAWAVPDPSMVTDMITPVIAPAIWLTVPADPPPPVHLPSGTASASPADS